MNYQLRPQYISKKPQERLYQLEKPILGLTGGIASGKSTAAHFIKEHGLHVICADELVKEVYREEKVLQTLREDFPQVINQDNQIQFGKLREIVFNDPEIKKKIETLIYSYLPEKFKQKANAIQDQNTIIYDVPLLFEKNLQESIDLSICVYTRPELQIKRILSRDGGSRELASKILSAQLPIDEKKSKADFVLDNQKDPEHLKKHIEQLFREIFL